MTLPTNFAGKYSERDSGCWLWTASVNSKGYGLVNVGGGRIALAHRVAYESTVGPIPDGLTIDHLCRVKRCINPAHLDPCTRRENAQRAAEQDRPTHCPHGHEYTPENTRTKVRRNGNVNHTCLTCERAYYPIKNAIARAQRAARRAQSAA